MRILNRLLFAFTVLLSTFLSANFAWAELPAIIGGKPVASIAPMLKDVLPAIVNISVVGEIPAVENPFADEFNDYQSKNPDQSPYQKRKKPNSPSYQGPHRFLSLGSGVIFNAEKGYIVTNAHVIRDAKSITVTLKNGQQYKAKLIGSDPASDIAVLQIHAQHLDALSFANSNNVKVGDFVVAIGNPFGLSQTVTSGIVSALQRTGLGIEGYENFIQTDAPINPGNSGGALVNFSGQLIGINTAILAPDGGNIGIGFAIPSDMVKSIITQLIKYGSVHRGLMGIMVQSITPNLATALNLEKPAGAIITMVTPFSPAAKAGLKVGDIITKVNNTNIDDAAEVTNIVGLTRVGSDIQLQVLRNQKLLDFEVQTASSKEYTKISRAENHFFYGINLRDFSQLNAIHGAVRGVQVVAVAQDSPAAQAMPVGLRPGDVIVNADGTSVTDVAQLQNVANTAIKDHKDLVLNVLRGTGALFVVLK